MHFPTLRVNVDPHPICARRCSLAQVAGLLLRQDPTRYHKGVPNGDALMTPDQFRQILRQELQPIHDRLGRVERAVLIMGSKLLAPEENREVVEALTP